MNSENNTVGIQKEEVAIGSSEEETGPDRACHHGRGRIDEQTTNNNLETVQETSTRSDQAIPVLKGDVEDESDVPPWHKTDDGKPAWLLNMLAQAAEEEDACDVYKRYRSAPKRIVWREMFGIKQRS